MIPLTTKNQLINNNLDFGKEFDDKNNSKSGFYNYK